MWVTGNTSSTNFPLQSLSGAYNQGTYGGNSDAFILKFSTAGVRTWATYYGGNSWEYGLSIHSDGTSVWLTGSTQSPNFPLQSLSGAYNQGTYGGGYCDAFIINFSTSCVRTWATYYGGTDYEQGNSIQSDGTSVWVTGDTESTNFPLQSLSGAYNQGTYGGGTSDVFILKFTAAMTGIKSISNEVPLSFSLSQNYPNPFNPTTNIRFDLPKSGSVKLVVFDALGREVATLVNEKLAPGTYEVDWNGSDYTSGVYFYRLVTDDFVVTKKMLLVK